MAICITDFAGQSMTQVWLVRRGKTHVGTIFRDQRFVIDDLVDSRFQHDLLDSLCELERRLRLFNGGWGRVASCDDRDTSVSG